MGKIKVFILAAVAVIAIFFIAGAIQNSDSRMNTHWYLKAIIRRKYGQI